ncbi:cytochrome P450 [uncultured Jatrophihabitans sp.]|uniref:cytochrome P450 n=1 Tax=uncultured Jatrophihabitans sp. TaxID=1610747 RepID=UPI0035CA4C9B
MSAFDHHSEQFAAGWRAEYAELRAGSPVVRTPAHGGYAVLTRYADVRRALLSPRALACGRDLELDGVPGPVSGGVTIPTNPFRMGMMEMDPPQGTAFRKLLMPWFSARATEASEPHLRELVCWCIDRVVESGRMDIVDDLANPLPTLVTLDLLGLPLENWQRYARVLHEAAYRQKGSARQLAWLLEDLRDIVERRRLEPPEIETPVDALIAAEIDGARLPADTVVEMVFMLLNGGIDTSTSLIAHSLRYLSANPSARQQLRDDPALIPAAVEEFLRYFTPGTGLARTVVEPMAVGDTVLAPGERVYLALGSANNDPAEFPDPDRVDFARDGNRHLSFGAGVHRCLGAFLAPREMAVLIEQVLARMPDLHVDESAVVAYPVIPLVAGFQAMPATFTPGPRLGSAPSGDAPPARGERELLAAAELARAESPAGAAGTAGGVPGMDGVDELEAVRS